jgi:signal transduction histidine kinase
MRARLRTTVKWLVTAGGVVVLALGVGGSVLAGLTLSDQAYREWRTEAARQAEALTGAFDVMLDDGRDTVRLISTHVSRDRPLSVEAFRTIHALARDPHARFQPAESAYVLRVLREHRDAFEAETGLTLHVVGNGAAEAPEAYEHFAVAMNTEQARLLSRGADLATEPALHIVLTSAYRRPNQVIASPVFERGGRQWVALAERPIYPGQPEQNALVVALVDFTAVLAAVHADTPAGLKLHMTQSVVGADRIGGVADVTTPPADAALAAETLSFRLGNDQARWTLDWYLYEQFAGGPATALGTLVTLGGVALTLLLGSLVAVLTLNNAQIRAREHQRSRELEAARDEAESANRYKSEFLASVSHELRTPLNAIIGFSDLIMREVKGPIGNARYGEYARDIHTSGRHLLGVINSIIDLSAIESGEFQLNEEPVSLPETIDAVRRIISLAAEKRGVTLETDVPPQMPRLLADQIAIEQILLNLGSNAVQFTPRGGVVTFAAGQTGDAIWMSVSDTGVGMDATAQARALQPFGQVVPPMHRVSDGAGLGLPIARELARRHAAIFDLDSRPGEGTRIRIRFDPSRTLPSATQAVA